jgi:uncharacterized protein
MELKDDIFIEAPREKVWIALNDPQVLAASIPGCEELTQHSPTENHARVLIKLGPVRARFVGKIRMSDIRPNEGCTLDFEGSGGAAGFAKGRSTIRLASEAAGTRVFYTAQASVGGKLGQIGGRMIDASAKQTADQFFTAFGEQLGPSAARATVTMSTPSAALAPAPITVARPSTVLGLATESTRILWFVLGALSTAFGFWLASVLAP